MTKTLPKKKRVLIVLLVLFFPIIGGMLQTVNKSISRSMNGYMTSPVVEVATEPITLAGAVFPAGSEVRYERTSLMSKTPVEATANEPVPFGPWQITNLVLFGYPERAERVSVSLSQPATIGQWLCRANSLVRFHRDGDDWMLDACTLDADVTIDDITWPAGTDIRRLEEGYSPVPSTAGGWNFISRPNCSRPIRGVELPFADLRVDYGPTLQFSYWEGVLCQHGENGLQQIGQYSVDSIDHAILLDDRSIEIKGFFRDTSSNNNLALCLHLDANGRNPQECKDEPATQP